MKPVAFRTLSFSLVLNKLSCLVRRKFLVFFLAYWVSSISLLLTFLSVKAGAVDRVTAMSLVGPALGWLDRLDTIGPRAHGGTGTSVIFKSTQCVRGQLKCDFVFRGNGRVHLNRRRRQFSRLLAAEVCASAVVMLDILCFETVWRVLATHSIRQFPPYFPSRTSPCAITFQLESTTQSSQTDFLFKFWEHNGGFR